MKVHAYKQQSRINNSTAKLSTV